MKRLLLGLALVLTLFNTLEAKNARAQGSTRVFASCNSATWNVLDVGRPLQLLPDGTLCVNASVSASIAGFTPNGNYATLTATAASSASTAMPAGAVVAFQNTSTIDVSCVLATGAATATTNKIVVRGGSTIFVTVGSNVNTACINQTGVASNLVALSGGTGLGTGFGGGAAGGGGGGAATIADGADVAEGATADAASTAGGVGTLSAKMRLMTTQLSTVFQAGGSIGNTTFASTQSGTWTMQPGNTANTTAWLMNVGAINGVTPLMGNGVTGTGSQRVTIASDNTAFTVNLGTLGGGATAANQTSQITQETATAGALGTTADAACGTGNGTCSLVALTKYSNITNPVLGAGSAVIGALTANQSVNLAQVAGVATPVGSGVQATAPRFTMATDSPGIIANAVPGTPNTTTVLSVQGQTGMTPLIANPTNGYPSGATAITASATGTTAATTATLAGVASKTTYVCGFAMRSNATAAATGTATMTGVITATMSFVHWTAPLASGIGLTEERFNPCIPASAVNTGIAVVSPAPGAGGTVSVAAWGFQL